MRIEQQMIVVVYDQSTVEQGALEVLRLGQEVAWALDRATAELYARRNPAMKLLIMDVSADILVTDDNKQRRLMDWGPLDPTEEKARARETILARLTPEDRAILGP